MVWLGVVQVGGLGVVGGGGGLGVVWRGVGMWGRVV